jgi:hypothetical protein
MIATAARGSVTHLLSVKISFFGGKFHTKDRVVSMKRRATGAP